MIQVLARSLVADQLSPSLEDAHSASFGDGFAPWRLRAAGAWWGRQQEDQAEPGGNI